jgi:hypothetical protein
MSARRRGAGSSVLWTSVTLGGGVRAAKVELDAEFAEGCPRGTDRADVSLIARRTAAGATYGSTPHPASLVAVASQPEMDTQVGDMEAASGREFCAYSRTG